MLDYNFDTRLIHGEDEFEEGSVNKPIFQTTSFAYKSAEELSRVFQKQQEGYTYSRVGNPTIDTFEKRIAGLEGGVGAVACSSGMAAIATALLSLLESGDEIVAGNSLFGGTFSLLEKDLKRWNIKTNFVEGTDLEAIQNALTEKTKVIYMETIGNPKLDLPDIEAVSKIAQKAKIPLIVDNTFLTPYLIRVKEFGANIVIHSTSKYINGSANSIGGIIVDLGNFNWQEGRTSGVEDYLHLGFQAYLSKIRQDIFRNLGVCSSPFNAFLNLTGLETLAVRMDKHCSNALKLAKFLDDHPLTTKVNYPGLNYHPQHGLAKKQLKNQFGGVLTFELENQEQCYQFIDSLKLTKNLANIGDIRTLVIHPASTIYCRVDREKKKELGVTDGLIRVSVGIENPEDIINDFKYALEAVK